jgi:hypothetical protein
MTKKLKKDTTFIVDIMVNDIDHSGNLHDGGFGPGVIWRCEVILKKGCIPAVSMLKLETDLTERFINFRWTLVKEEEVKEWMKKKISPCGM